MRFGKKGFFDHPFILLFGGLAAGFVAVYLWATGVIPIAFPFC